MKKKIAILLLILLTATLAVACNNVQISKLDTPTGLTVIDGQLRWNSVANASEYVVNQNGLDVGVVSTMAYGLSGLTAGESYAFKVKARHSLGLYGESDYSAVFEYTHSAAPVTPPEEGDKTVLMTPSNLNVNNGVVSWTAVPNAASYIVYIDGAAYSADTNELAIDSLKTGVYKIKVKAISGNEAIKDSEFCEEQAMDLYDGSVSSTQYFSQFEDLNQFESFLGYGFDVISDSVVCDRTVLTSFPIFDVKKLMDMRFVKVNSKASNVEVISESSMEAFSKKWNAALNVNVSASANYKGMSIGGSRKLTSEFSRGDMSIESQYYYCITITDQKFYIIMQGDMDSYRERLSAGFMKDLYDVNVDPRILFQRYGTHFITSAVMGGRMNAFYNMYSFDESVTRSSYASIGSTITAGLQKIFSLGLSTSFSSGIEKAFEDHKVEYKHSLNVMGGGDFGIASIGQIPEHFADWQKSLDAYPSLMGIKDESSLVGIWELIDRDKDTQAVYTLPGHSQKMTRAEQLQAYFYEYGVDNYNKLMDATNLDKIVRPASIDNVIISGKSANNDGYYYVDAGTSNPISFSVLPANAVGYVKTYTVDNDSIAYFDGGQLVIRPSASIPSGSILNVTLGAGNVRKSIKIKINRTYDVEFDLNFDTDFVASVKRDKDKVSSIKQGIKEGASISPPTTMIRVDEDGKIIPGSETAIERFGYKLTGWSAFVDGQYVQFDFTRPVTANVTLFANWIKIVNKVHFNARNDTPETYQDIDYYQTAVKPKNPIREHYAFAGWFEQGGNDNLRYDFSTPVVEEIYLYAKWEPMVYTIQVYGEGQRTEYKTDISKDFRINVTPPVKEFYHVYRWRLADNSYIYDINTYAFKKDTSVTAEYEPTVYEIRFDTMGGSNVDGRTASITSEFRISGEVGNPTKDGYNFNGWFINKSGEQQAIPDIMTYQFKQNTVVHADWTVNGYKVMFETNGAGEIAPYENRVYGSKISAPSAPVKNGYIFGGWYTDRDLSVRFRFETDTVKGPTTLYAKWYTTTQTLATVSFVTNADGIGLADITLAVGETLGKAHTTLIHNIREGYRFDGWYIDAALTQPFNSDATVGGDMTLYAKWAAMSYVLHLSDGTNIISSTEYIYGSEIGEINAPARTGYTFAGWDNLPQTMPAKNLTVTALWNANIYTVYYYFDTQKTVIYRQEKFAFGTALHLEITEPEQVNYTFGGWSSSLPDAMPAHDVEIVPLWTPIDYPVKYYLTSNANLNSAPFAQLAIPYGTHVNDIVNAPVAADSAVYSEGYTFGGWDYKTDIIRGGLNAYAIWKPVEVNVTYLYGTKTKTVKAEYGRNLYTCAEDAGIVLDESGFIFSGIWETDKGFEVMADETVPAKDITLRALYSVSKVSLHEPDVLRPGRRAGVAGIGAQYYAEKYNLTFDKLTGFNQSVLHQFGGTVKVRIRFQTNQGIRLSATAGGYSYYDNNYNSQKLGTFTYDQTVTLPYVALEEGLTLTIQQVYWYYNESSKADFEVKNIYINVEVTDDYCVAFIVPTQNGLGVTIKEIYSCDASKINGKAYYEPKIDNCNFKQWTANNRKVGRDGNNFNFLSEMEMCGMRSLVLKAEVAPNTVYTVKLNPETMETDGQYWHGGTHYETLEKNRSRGTASLSSTVQSLMTKYGYKKVKISIKFDYYCTNDCNQKMEGYFDGISRNSKQYGCGSGESGNRTLDLGEHDIKYASKETKLEIWARGKDKYNKWKAYNIRVEYTFIK